MRRLALVGTTLLSLATVAVADGFHRQPFAHVRRSQYGMPWAKAAKSGEGEEVGVGGARAGAASRGLGGG